MISFHKPTLIVLLLLLALAFLFGGCNTARGFGRDVEKAGEKIQEEANALIPRDFPPINEPRPRFSQGARKAPFT